MDAQLLLGNEIPKEVDERSSNLKVLKVLSPGEWLKLKPIIQRLYIDENKTFKVVASILMSESGFHPTKRQFTRKVEEWGLKKNLRRAERKVLLENGDSKGTAYFSISDKRILDPRRIQRLKRRYGHESQRPQDLPPEEIDAVLIPATTELCPSLGEQQSTVNHVEEFPASHSMPPPLGIPDDNTAMDTEYWPFDWDAVNVPGSPGLTRLFERLELEALIESIDLDDGAVDRKQLVSGIELRDRIERDSTTNTQISSAHSHMNYGSMSKAALQLVQTPKKILQWSPLFELDIFPNFRNTPSHRMMLPASTRSVETWNIEAKELESKLSKLMEIQSGHNQAIILCIEHLIFFYINLNRNPLGLYHRLLDARLKEVNRNDDKIIANYLDIVEELLRQGKNSDAKHLHGSLCQTIQESGSSVEKSLHIRSSYLGAVISSLNNPKFAQEAEKPIRLLVQKALRFLGPSHKTTINALSLLASSLETSGTKSYSEAEKLYRYIIQAGRSDFQNEPWSYLEYIRQLIDNLRVMRQFEASHNLCTYIVRHLKQTFGERHYEIRLFQRTLGVILREWGRLPESIEIFHELTTEEDMDQDPFRASICFEFAYALHEDGNYRKAVVWYKRCLLYTIKLYGWNNNYNMIQRPSERLGLCYEKLSRFEDALLFYKKLLGKIKIALPDDHPHIEAVESWISWVQFLNWRSASSDKDENEEHESEEDENEDVVDDVSLDEIFEIEDGNFDKRIGDIGKQMSAIKLF